MFDNERETAEHPGYGNTPPEAPKTRRARRWPYIAAAVFAGLLIVGALAAYAYDNSHKDEIADGITAGGVDLGGLSAAEAKHRLRHELVAPLQRPLVVRFRGQAWKLPGRKLKVHANINSIVDRALAESQNGGLPGRVVRYVTGGTVDKQIAPQIGYFEPAINRFARQLNAAVEHARTGRPIVAQVHSIAPTVTKSQVAAEYPSYLTLDRTTYTLRLWKNLKLAKSYTVAVGQAGLETPAGLYHIQDKQVNPSWHVPNSAWAGSLAGQVIPPGPADPIKARWMGIFNGAGIHGTDETWSLGQAVSHGCVRMSIPDVISLYDQVDVGTPIYIG